MLKRLLKIYDLNQQYTGGLGSYSLFLMLLFINKMAAPLYMMDPVMSKVYPAKLFIYFLSYYG